MAKVRALRDFHKTVTKKNNGKSDDKVPRFLSSASGSVNEAQTYIISNDIKSYTQPRKNDNISVSERIKNEVGEYALIHGTKSALEKFRKKYPKYTFIRTPVNNWKKKNEKHKRNDNVNLHRRKGRPNLLQDEFLVKLKDVVTRSRMAGGRISRKMVIAIDTGVIKANCPSKLKIEPSKQFSLEDKVIFQRCIASIIE